MSILEDAKRTLEHVTGLWRPDRDALPDLVRARKPHLFRFADDGKTPNNRLPLVVYRGAIGFPAAGDPAAVIEDVFASHGWKDSWRDGIYPFLHFHTATHEVVGIARGTVRVQYGGNAGKPIDLKAGDVVVVPAGVGHYRKTASKDLLVVGAYPANGGKYDEPKPREVDPDEARAAIAKVARPKTDPVCGKDGPLRHLWK